MGRWLGAQRAGCARFEERDEYHTLACAETHIIIHEELVEGRHRAKELGQKKYNEEFGSLTAGLLVRMAEASQILQRGKVHHALTAVASAVHVGFPFVVDMF